ncbi:MAG TPA: uracil-DNA glycosylase [Lamprocystis sp. (in: g-proteobacteria)]|nr:uracil-DNA glycosylase [Lamprocystis sp. (in: g-proteobacteria)]
MDESRRRAYLRAMGIDLWVPRQTAAPQSERPPEALTAPPPDPPAEPLEPLEWPAEPEADLDPQWEPVWEPHWDPTPEPTAPPRVQAAPWHPAPQPTKLPANLPPAPATMDWDALTAAVAQCRACALCETRTQTVFGVGDRQAHLLVIGEAPGADEDREGEPFVGPAGQLLNLMLAAIGLERRQVYITNILKCRPPGNRNPRPDEVKHCRDFLARQVDLIQPRAILTVGAVSAQTLLGTETPVGRLRGRWFDFGPGAIPLRVTYHPAYLLRSPEHKGKAWEDLIAVAHRLADAAAPEG